MGPAGIAPSPSHSWQAAIQDRGMMVAQLYEMRQPVQASQTYEVPLGIHSIVAPYRVIT